MTTIVCSKCGATSDDLSSTAGFNPCHLRDPKESHSFRVKIDQPKLKDGMPKLHQIWSKSRPSIPSADEHAECKQSLSSAFKLKEISNNVLNAQNSSFAHCQVDSVGEKSRFYGSERDIVHIVRNFLSDIIQALNLPMLLRNDISIKQMRENILVVFADKVFAGKSCIVGVVEIKLPGGNNILCQHTVLGELLEQMLLVEGFYCAGPILGILTTAEEWLVAVDSINASGSAVYALKFDNDDYLSSLLKHTS